MSRSILHFLLLLVMSASVSARWFGWNFYNTRFSIGFTQATDEHFVWSDNPHAVTDNYYLNSISYSSRSCSSCYCNEAEGTVTGCSGNVILKNYYITSLTNLSFNADTTSIKIYNIPELTVIEEDTFDNLASLTELHIHRTGITVLPDISNTQIWILMLAQNNIRLFRHNYTDITWPSSLTHVALQDNRIHYLPDDYFANSSIEFLQLSRNQIRNFPEMALQHLPKLKHLSLSENQLKQISTNHLSGISYNKSQLLSLNLSNNYLDYIQPLAFSTLPHLILLEVHNNALMKTVKGVFSDIPKLEYLSLNHNQLEVLYSHSLVNLPSLIELRLHSQTPAMTNIHYDAFYNINESLKELWVSDNGLLSFPHQVLSEQVYSKLTKVYAGSNYIRDPILYGKDGFADDQGPLWVSRAHVWYKWNVTTPNIQILYLESNGMTSLAENAFCELQFLHTLNLAGNRLTNENTSIPDDLFACHSHLTVLYLQDNLLEYVPVSISSEESLPAIQQLFLHYNKLIVIERGAFSNLTSLTILNLQNNLIITIEDGAFPASSEEIYLQNNQLRFTQPETFLNLTNLRKLYLDNNQISDFSPSTFKGCTSLTEFSLSSNHLSWLNSSLCPDSTTLNKFYAADNQIALIGTNTFSHITSSMDTLNLSNNKITSLSGLIDFHSRTIDKLYLNYNHITSIQSRTFEYLITTTFELSGNQIAYIESNAFVDCSARNLYLTSNPLKFISSYAFNLGSYINLHLNDNQLRHLAPHTFHEISGGHLLLQRNAISYIEAEAFSKVSFHTIHLERNGMTDILGNMFVDSTVTNNLYLNDNLLTVLVPVTFLGLSSGSISLDNNQLTVYPGDALSLLNLETIDLSNNKLEQIPDGSFDQQTGLRHLNLDINLLDHIQENLFDSLDTLETLSISNNQLGYIAANLFNHSSSLTSINLSNNRLSHIPPLYGNHTSEIESLDVDLTGNNIETVSSEAFIGIEIISLSLSTEQLKCGCSLYQALLASNQTMISGTAARCDSPDHLNSVTLLTADRPTTPLNESYFMCEPYDLQYSQPDINVIQLSWAMADISGPSFTSSSMFFVRCWTPLDDSDSDLTATVSDRMDHTFVESDGVVDETIYLCTVQQKLYYSNTSTYTAPSDPVYLTTILDTRKNVTQVLGDIILPVSLYDFSIDSPQYVPSPYGAWLAISDTPSLDSFSDWFRLVPDTNYQFNSTLVLKGYASEGTHRFYSSKFYPVDRLGYMDEGQQNCDGVPSNLAFTSAVRSGFIYQGNESIAISGGEIMWLYLNRKLVLQVFNEESTSFKVCRKLNISAAGSPGGAFLTPEAGIIVNGKCQITTGLVPEEEVHLQLEVGERYHFTIFHVERQGCDSYMLIDATGFDFILDSLEEPPRDYIVYIDEDFYVGGIIETIFLADSFSAGPPFILNILRGNEARHLTVINASTATAAAAASAEPVPVIPTYTSVQVDGQTISFIECDGLAAVLPDGNASEVESFLITTETLYVTLSSSVDYEVSTAYTVVLEVIDYLKVPPLIGQVTLKVNLNDINDNCPYLEVTEYYIIGVPPMSVSPYLKLNATDTDSTTNAELVHQRTTPQLQPEFSVIANQTLDIYKHILPFTSNVTYIVVITDRGSPTRGTLATVTYEISNTCILDTWFSYIPSDQLVDLDTGEIYISIPGYYSQPYACNGEAGIEKGWVRDTLITASSEQSFAEAPRARLNLPTLNPIVSGLVEGFSGGWRPAADDTEPWLQVDVELPYVFTQIAVQGHDQLPNWVTRFSLNHSYDNINWSQHTDEAGDIIEYDIAVDLYGNETAYFNITPRIYGQYVRVLVLSWNTAVALRMELYGCQQKELEYWNRACLRCETSWYCPGDGQHLPCGRCDPPLDMSSCGRSPTEHSFGYRDRCEECPIGWTCKEGHGFPCGQFLYTECNDTRCSNCTQCEAGYACRGGVKYLCPVGTYSDGYSEFCIPCSAGEYQDAEGQSSCISCPAGYSSNRAHDRCTICSTNTYSTSGGLCKGCSSSGECPCMPSAVSGSPCFDGVPCANTGSGLHVCESCPPGFAGDGVVCTDIDECAVHLPCWDSTRCMNTAPGFQCLACPLGTVGNFEDAWAFNYTDRTFELYNLQRDEIPYQVCEDVDECSLNNGGCDVNAYCINTEGSFYCGLCKEGYMGSSIYGCYPNNFCTSNHSVRHHKCSINADCIFTGPGTYKCECSNGWAGNGFLCGEDDDQDGIPTLTQSCFDYTCRKDNCPTVPNSGQEDNDNDWAGDVCDDDDDNDGVLDLSDNCQYDSNRVQEDTDGDLIGDVCDNCPLIANTNQLDTDRNGLGNACDDDEDGDGVLSTMDNCPLHINPGQEDGDLDGVGDVCDNCLSLSNPDQIDINQDGTGDLCEQEDFDGDGIQNDMDNCMHTGNSEQADTNSDGASDRCDLDLDGDGIINDEDNCPYVVNLLQSDIDEDYVGDACEDDYDNDGVGDKYDDCPYNMAITTTDFTTYTNINLYPTLPNALNPSWLVLHDGKEVRQLTQTDMPAMLIVINSGIIMKKRTVLSSPYCLTLQKDNSGDVYYDSMDFSGTIFANTDTCNGYLGFVFAYQSNKKFYAILWRHNHLNYPPDYAAGIKGLQIKAVNSLDGPSYALARDLWHTADSSNVKLLYHDPWLRSWQCKTSYKLYIKHRPDIGLIRVTIKHQDTLIMDSGDVYETSISGGRVGLITFQQDFGIWSNLRVQCADTVNRALQFDGVDDAVKIGSIQESVLDLLESFTISLWVYISDISRTHPLVCTESGVVCLSVSGGVVTSVYSTYELKSNVNMTAAGWTNIIYRYNAEDYALTLFLNGTNTACLSDVAPHDWNGTADRLLYLGRSSSGSFLHGLLDEVKIYDISVIDNDLPTVWQQAAFSDAVMKEHLKVYLPMNDNTDYSEDLVDLGYLRLNGDLLGSPQFVDSTMQKSRFRLTYPNNTRRRRSVYHYLAQQNQLKVQKFRTNQTNSHPKHRQRPDNLLKRFLVRHFNDEL